MISREVLYQLVWSKPVTKVAAEFGVSGSYLARMCTLLNVPRPERGYWAKLAVGKAPSPQPLPEPRLGDQLHWSNDGLQPPQPPPPRSVPIRRKRRIRLPENQIHNLVAGAKVHFENSRTEGDEGYLKPFKKLLVDVTASRACLSKALDFANTLFNEFEAWAPSRIGLFRGQFAARQRR